MAPRNDCFAIEMPYNMNPPDGAANHYSLYMSLFGDDVPGGRLVQVKTRMIVERGFEMEKAAAMYEEYIQ